ncbi:MAG: anhydro-N-acetylmuramic acid kinase [Chitinophagales bacterium]|nr:anhydro-N-acetylmuramic acid kinase [Chitinophagales bacterium]MCZ2394563.1 anhydro-N-acetylmuramic acid kinase [Chitinophagales bacterium]
MNEYRVIGLMSGTSLDGLDICYSLFTEDNGKWNFEIQASKCYEYTPSFQKELRNLHQGTAYELAEMHQQFSVMQAELIQSFFTDYPQSLNAIIIVSHGQTIFHQPNKSFTTQIGCGATLSALTGKPVVCDLRTYDMALGGQGAPLVPLGERYLFPSYSNFINIGGICNVSIHHREYIHAYDVCPGNTLLNLLSQQKGFPYDYQGQFARAGKMDQNLLKAFESVSYYQKSIPKSLGTENILSDWLPHLNGMNISLEDKLSTVVEHIAIELAKAISQPSKTLITGGGAFNQYLIERIQHYSSSEIIVPPKETIEFKEALIIGFLGLMRYLGRNNCLSSVTGAKSDSMGGAIYG